MSLTHAEQDAYDLVLTLRHRYDKAWPSQSLSWPSPCATRPADRSTCKVKLVEGIAVVDAVGALLDKYKHLRGLGICETRKNWR
jgi:hypothetical protein